MTNSTTDQNPDREKIENADRELELEPGTAPVMIEREDGSKTIIKRSTGREEMEALIAQRRKRQVQKELAPEDGDEDRDEQGRFVEGNRAAAKRAPQAEDGAPAPQPEDDEPKVRVIVYGEERMVPQREVEAAGGLELYQKAAATDYNFQRSKETNAEAKRLRDEAKQIRDELAAMREQARQAPTAAPAPERRRAQERALTDDGAVGDDGLTEAQRQELAAMAEEFSDEVVDTRRLAFIANNNLSRQRDIDMDALADQLEGRRRAREEKQQIAQANRYFSEHYASIEADPDLSAIAVRKINELRGSDPNRSWLEVVKEAGEYVKSRHQTTSEQQSPLERRQERKRSTPMAPVPSAGGRMPPRPAPAPERPLTPSETIASMRANRPGG